MLQFEADILKVAKSKPIDENIQYVELRNQLAECLVETEGQKTRIKNLNAENLEARLEVEGLR